MEGERSRRLLLQEGFGEFHPAVSPDGRWIAYQSDESGQMEIYVRPFPNVEEGKWQISRGAIGEEMPLWAPDGRELFYCSGNKMMAVSIQSEPNFAYGIPQVLFERRRGVGYDISPDGQRFLMIKEAPQTASAPAELILVQNWSEELKRLVPTH